jgi:hypothetical protein
MLNFNSKSSKGLFGQGIPMFPIENSRTAAE